VLRGVARGAQESGDLYRWALEVVAQACSERRNVRVSQPRYRTSILLLNGHASHSTMAQLSSWDGMQGLGMPAFGVWPKAETGRLTLTRWPCTTRMLSRY